jgi:DNA-binding helix-hairpin-helix protein with protein kinase domain
MKDEYPSAVADTTGARYALGHLLGRGGQGVVFAVQGRPLAIKLLTATAQSSRQRLQESIARVKRLPLEGLRVARPLRALASPHVGYVMELMTGMEPLSRMAQIPSDRRTSITPWYLETGGLLRRLRVLAKAADLFAELHGRGLAYGDASPANIFMSQSHDAHETWLIDCDNVESGVSRRAVYTPGYAAPELFQSRGSDSLTDSWSLATIAFQTLCVLHPFEGDDVHEGEPELEARAFEGKMPWVDDASGANVATRGFPRDLVLTPDLKELSESCFGRSRTERLQRPGVATWAEKLHRAADQVLHCAECASSFYLNNLSCPWCDTPRPAFAVASVFLCDPKLTDRKQNPMNLVCREPGRPRPIHRVVVQPGRALGLGDRVLRGVPGDAPIVQLDLDEQRLKVVGGDGVDWVLRHRMGKEIPLAGRKEYLDLSTGPRAWWLLPRAPQGLHRAVSFEWISGEQP